MLCDRHFSYIWVVVLIGSASLSLADEGPYVKGQAGGDALSDSDLDSGDTEAEFAPGYNLSGALGYRWGKFRLEGELGYVEYEIDEVDFVGL